MLEKIKSVSNPLTIIGLFCGVVEVVGLIVMGTGNLAPEAQRDLIWLVKWFPVILVSLFFVTLWFKDRVLYAPGDFKDEKNYLDLARANAKQSLDIEIVQKMIASASSEIISEVSKTFPTNEKTEGIEMERFIKAVGEIIQDKLQPIQSFAGTLKNDKYAFSPTITADSITIEFNIWKLLSADTKPMTLKEIASALSLNEYFVSTLLFSLIKKDMVKEKLEEGGRKTYSAIPMRNAPLIGTEYKAPSSSRRKDSKV
jgi:predicted DNA-binding transcriptional regulator